MTINELLSGIPVAGGNIDMNRFVGRLKIDSREIRAGDTFIARKGMSVDGHCFAAKAVQNGASLVISERPLDDDIPHVVLAEPYPQLAELAARYYDFPSRKLKMLGVTGTNGKTTITHMLHEFLTARGIKAGLIGTNRVRINKTDLPTERTTPDALRLQELLARMKDEGCEYCIMEVSSHALDLGRVHGIQYLAGGFTNLTQDHLDYHGSMEEYFAVKRRLFGQCGAAVINTSDAYGERLASELTAIPILTVNAANADFQALELEMNADCVRYKAVHGDESAYITWRTPGGFSVQNSLMALALLNASGFSLTEAAEHFEKLPPVKGRMEPVEFEGGVTVLIDYAHTPDALENVLKSAREFTSGRLICVFGCGGNRDREKRPLMGQISTTYADISVVTSDNPRFEKPQDIIDEIKTGCKGNSIDICDRREAIAWALKNAKSGDVVMLCGKGHETYQEIEGQKTHMDEREIVAALRSETNE